MIDFIQKNMNFLNDIQAYHWQTKSYAEHEALGEFYTKFNELNDRFVETYQGKTHQRISFSAELRPGIRNYADKFLPPTILSLFSNGKPRNLKKDKKSS